MSLETTKRVLNCYLNSYLLYATKRWTVSLQLQKRLKAAELLFYLPILRYHAMEHVNDWDVLRRVETYTYT